jgi:plasmid stability protein
MAVSLSIKQVPEDVARALRQRAASNHRSVQGELMHILVTAVRPKPFQAMAMLRELKPLKAPTRNESARMVRQMRDTRY